MEQAINPILYVGIILFLMSLFFFALFSFIETSITALRLFKLRELKEKTKKYTSLFDALEKSPQKVLTTVLIATSVVNVVVAALSSTITERIFARIGFGKLGFSLGVCLAAIAILIFGEIIPKNLAKTRGEKIFKATLWLTNLTYTVLRPIVPMLTRLSDYLILKMGGSKSLGEGSEWVASEKEIQFLIEHINEKGLMETEKSEMLRSIFQLGTTPVKEVMVPSVNVTSIDITSTFNQAFELFSKKQFTRLPAYDEKTDNIVGMIHLKDVFMLWSRAKGTSVKETPIKDLLRPIPFIPETMKINQLLRELREKHQHIAMVTNEYGSITGLITLEDVLEEIVGEISDEYEATSEKIIPLKQGGWLIDASMPLTEVGELLEISFEVQEALTLGGFLTEKFKNIPKKGERLLYKNYYFQVQKATPKRAVQILVFKEKTEQEEKK